MHASGGTHHPHIPPPPHLCSYPHIICLAKGESWSPATNRRYPQRFKAAARTLLLLAGGSRAERRALPPDVALSILQLASEPMFAWVCEYYHWMRLRARNLA